MKTYLPSSHGGGELPGNQRGLSGGSGSHTLDTPPFLAPTFVVILEQVIDDLLT